MRHARKGGARAAPVAGTPIAFLLRGFSVRPSAIGAHMTASWARDLLAWAGAGHRFLQGRSARELVTEALAAGDVEVGGSRPWDMRVHDDRAFERMLRDGPLGVGESYMEGWWDSDHVDQTLHRSISARVDHKLDNELYMAVATARWHLFNLQTPTRAPTV